MILEGRVPPRPDGNDWMKGTVPPGPRDAVERIPPCPPGASEVAKRLECACLLALSDNNTPPRGLQSHPNFSGITVWDAQTATLPLDGKLPPGPDRTGSPAFPNHRHETAWEPSLQWTR